MRPIIGEVRNKSTCFIFLQESQLSGLSIDRAEDGIDGGSDNTAASFSTANIAPNSANSHGEKRTVQDWVDHQSSVSYYTNTIYNHIVVLSSMQQVPRLNLSGYITGLGLVSMNQKRRLENRTERL